MTPPTMAPLAVLVQSLTLLLGPAGVLALCRRFPLLRRLGPVVLAYAAGVALGNLPGLSLSAPLSLRLSELAVVLAIPLFLFGVDVKRWLGVAGPTLLSFGACVASVLVAAAVGAHLFAGTLEGTPALAGMLVGVYTGGTPNMAAIGEALAVPAETFVLMNGADLLLGAAYLFFLLSVGRRLLGAFLPAGTADGGRGGAPEDTGAREPRGGDGGETAATPPPRAYLGALLLAALVAAVAFALGSLVAERGRTAATLLILTTLALALSFVPRVRRLAAAESAGTYLLLLFCVAMGSLADAETLLGGSGRILAFVAFVLFGSILLHLLAARVLSLDRDTVIVTSTAAIFGPAFVPAVVAALGNRQALLSGISMGLLGYAIGNYLGIGLWWVLS